MSPWESFFSSRSARRRSTIIMAALFHRDMRKARGRMLCQEQWLVGSRLGRDDILSQLMVLFSLCSFFLPSLEILVGKTDAPAREVHGPYLFYDSGVLATSE